MAADPITAALDFVLMMRQKEQRFRGICRQLVLINNDIRYVKKRYERAIRSDRKSFRYQARLKLITMVGVRDMFQEYATAQADELDALEEQLATEHNINWAEICDN